MNFILQSWRQGSHYSPKSNLTWLHPLFVKVKHFPQRTILKWRIGSCFGGDMENRERSLLFSPSNCHWEAHCPANQVSLRLAAPSLLQSSVPTLSHCCFLSHSSWWPVFWWSGVALLSYGPEASVAQGNSPKLLFLGPGQGFPVHGYYCSAWFQGPLRDSILKILRVTYLLNVCWQFEQVKTSFLLCKMGITVLVSHLWTNWYTNI